LQISTKEAPAPVELSLSGGAKQKYHPRTDRPDTNGGYVHVEKGERATLDDTAGTMTRAGWDAPKKNALSLL